ncbi:hypothetical protein [Rubrivivax gelatinosus]|uniref:Uncharacterized protein n=1 Tax=Rubrivivax gelatinosus (strain NBRC 100245 / IL144) TaxID=983917 RepID=I0HNS5_RUBGI|nr:hypothetical protein [Rubrivivax gelatinosus]BAL94662.1 hypothetical protein RGE_13210 [Rubrivivax gelatinosus IL144]
MGPLSQIDRSTTTSHDAASAARAVTAVHAVDTSSDAVRVRQRSRQETRETGDVNIDQALASSNTSPRTVTYSFSEVPAAVASVDLQQSRSTSDRQRVREALNYYATVAQVQFVEVGAGGDLQYTVTAAPSPAEVQKARAAETQSENEAQDERRDSQAAVAQQQATAEAAAKVQQSQQTDDLLGLNLPDPDGQGGTPTIG